MKIAIFSDNFYPELSGISDSIITLGKELAGLGHKINFYVPRYSRKDYRTANVPYKELDLGNNIKICRYNSIPYPAPTNQARLVFPTGLRWIGLLKFKPDIIHTQLFFGVGLEALAAAKFLKTPIIGTNHTAITEFARYSPIKSEWVKKAMLKYAVWYYNHCDFVTAPSESVFKEMKECGFGKPSLVISNPIDTEAFKAVDEPEKIKIKEKLGLSLPTIVYAGRLAEEKNIDVILKAVSEVLKKRQIILAVAGHGTAESPLKKLAEKLGIERNIKFLGTLEKADLAKLYQASEIFVITSTSETQSMTLMQAFSCGLPAIGVSSRALPEYINEKNGFLINPGDYLALSEKINFILENKNIAKTLREGALIFSQNFSAGVIAKKWEQIYSNVAKSHILGYN